MTSLRIVGENFSVQPGGSKLLRQQSNRQSVLHVRGLLRKSSRTTWRVVVSSQPCPVRSLAAESSSTPASCNSRDTCSEVPWNRAR